MENNLKLYDKIAALIENARQYVSITIDTTMAYTYYQIGGYIIENEQQGKSRAKYGKAILKELSTELTRKFGRGFSVDNLKICVSFMQFIQFPKHRLGN